MSGENIGHAILILGMIFYGYNYGWEWWTVALILLSAGSWGVFGHYSDNKAKLKAEIKLLEEKARWYSRRSGDSTQ